MLPEGTVAWRLVESHPLRSVSPQSVVFFQELPSLNRRQGVVV